MEEKERIKKCLKKMDNYKTFQDWSIKFNKDIKPCLLSTFTENAIKELYSGNSNYFGNDDDIVNKILNKYKKLNGSLGFKNRKTKRNKAKSNRKKAKSKRKSRRKVRKSR